MLLKRLFKADYVFEILTGGKGTCLNKVAPAHLYVSINIDTERVHPRRWK